MLTAAVSGSFHRHMAGISAAVRELSERSVCVLSPADPRIVAHKDGFLFVASDRHRSIKLVQDRHLDCIKAADFLWLVCPDGYVGVSAAMEVCAAGLSRVPVFASRAPSDVTVREYVRVVSSLAEAVRIVAESARPKRPKSILIDPHASVEEAHDSLERIEKALTDETAPDDPAPRVFHELTSLQERLRLPTPVH